MNEVVIYGSVKAKYYNTSDKNFLLTLKSVYSNKPLEILVEKGSVGKTKVFDVIKNKFYDVEDYNIKLVATNNVGRVTRPCLVSLYQSMTSSCKEIVHSKYFTYSITNALVYYPDGKISDDNTSKLEEKIGGSDKVAISALKKASDIACTLLQNSFITNPLEMPIECLNVQPFSKLPYLYEYINTENESAWTEDGDLYGTRSPFSLAPFKEKFSIASPEVSSDKGLESFCKDKIGTLIDRMLDCYNFYTLEGGERPATPSESEMKGLINSLYRGAVSTIKLNYTNVFNSVSIPYHVLVSNSDSESPFFMLICPKFKSFIFVPLNIETGAIKGSFLPLNMRRAYDFISENKSMHESFSKVLNNYGDEIMIDAAINALTCESSAIITKIEKANSIDRNDKLRSMIDGEIRGNRCNCLSSLGANTTETYRYTFSMTNNSDLINSSELGELVNVVRLHSKTKSIALAMYLGDSLSGVELKPLSYHSGQGVYTLIVVGVGENTSYSIATVLSPVDFLELKSTCYDSHIYRILRNDKLFKNFVINELNFVIDNKITTSTIWELT